MSTLHTPLYNLPYPDGAERVMDGDNAMGALALAIENLIAAQRVAAPSSSAQTGGSLAATTSAVVVPGTAITIVSAAPERLWAVAMFDMLLTTVGVGTLRGSIFRGGALAIQAVLIQPTAGTRQPGMAEYTVDVPAGSTTFDLRWQKDVAGGVASLEYSRLVVARFPT